MHDEIGIMRLLLAQKTSFYFLWFSLFYNTNFYLFSTLSFIKIYIDSAMSTMVAAVKDPFCFSVFVIMRNAPKYLIAYVTLRT